jgi:hypothetical protein
MKRAAGFLAIGTAVLALSACSQAAAPHGQQPAGGSRPSMTAAVTAGTVTGEFRRVGGPLGPGGQQPAAVPLAGIVRFSSPGRRIDVPAANSGRFTAVLPAGTYAVSGRSPSIEEQLPGGRQAEPWCRQWARITVRPGHLVRITVTCAVP